MSQANSAPGQALTLKIKFKSENQETFVERYGGDVSPGGIFIRSRNPLTIGTKIAFDLSLSTGAALLQGNGTVVWVRPPDARQPGGGTPGMGIRFDQLKDDSRARLNELLAEKTRRERAGQPVGRGPTPIPEATAGADADAHDRATKPVTPARDTARSASADSAVHRAPTPHRGVPTVAGRAPAGFHVPGGMRDSFAEPTRQARPAGFNTPAPAPAARMTAPAGQGGEFDDKPRTPVFGAKVDRGAPRQGGVAGEPAFKAESTRSGSPSQALLDRATPVQGRPVFARRTPPPVSPSIPVGANADFQSQVPTAAPRGSAGGHATDTASGTVKSARRSGALEWESEKTEIMEDIPAFEFGGEEEGEGEGEGVDIEESKTTTVAAQALPAMGQGAPGGPRGAGKAPSASAAPAFQGLPAHLLPQGASVPSAALPVESHAPPEEKTPAFDEPKTVGLRPRHASAELENLFDGEELPVSPEMSSPLVPSVGSSSDELLAASRSMIGTGSHGGARVARKGPAGGKRVLLFALVAILVVAGAAAAVELTAEGGVLGLLGLGAPAPASDVPVAPVPVAPAPVVQAPVVQVPDEPAPVAPEAVAPEPKAEAAVPATTPAPTPAPTVEAPPAAPAPPVPGKPAALAPTAAEGSETARPGTRPAARPQRPAAVEGSEDEIPGWLRVRSVPEGAEVFIDGNKEGTTPFERRVLDITAPHALSVRKSGYEAHERLISGSDPWVRRYNEASLTLTVRLRRALGEPGEPAGPAQGAAPAAPPDPPAAPEPAAP